MKYCISLEELSLNEYKKILLDMPLIKSRLILRENINENFNKINKLKINNIFQLRNNLKTKNKLDEFSITSEISQEYLKILLREINSLIPKPNSIKDFPLLDSHISQKLINNGFKDTKKIFDLCYLQNYEYVNLINLGLRNEDITLIKQYVDISRIRWVNHTFATVLIKLGYSSSNKISQANQENLYKELREKNNGIYTANIGLNDINVLIQWAKWVNKNLN